MRLLGASVLVVAAGIGLGLHGIMAPSSVQPPAPHAVVAGAHPALEPIAPADSGHPTSAMLQVPPVHISIPALGISSPLGPSRGLNANGTINDAPLSGPIWSLPWWYRDGPAPGQVGSAVMLGHVDSAAGAGHLGVLFRLGDAKPGEDITVGMADGSVTAWQVTSARLYPDDQFPGALVYDHSGPPTLRVVTCGGTFNWQSHHYESAIVVTARLVSPLPQHPMEKRAAIHASDNSVRSS